MKKDIKDITVDDISKAEVVYSDAKAGAGFFFSVDDSAYNFKVTATLKDPKAFGKTDKDVVTLDAKSVTYKYNNKDVTSPAKTFQKGTNKYELEVFLKGKSLSTKAVAYIGVRGDANLDYEVDSKDAIKVLQYYADGIADTSKTPVLYDSKDANLEKLAKILGNADLDGKSMTDVSVLDANGVIDTKDAIRILQYFADTITAGDKATWK